MNLEEASTDQLLKWLTRELSNICEADPAVLAKYVLALLRHDAKDGEELQLHCIDQLRDFLKEETENFVSSLFSVLGDGSYKVDVDDIDEEDAIDDENNVDGRNYRQWQRNRDGSDEEADDDRDDSRRRIGGRRGSTDDFLEHHNESRKKSRYDDQDGDGGDAVVGYGVDGNGSTSTINAGYPSKYDRGSNGGHMDNRRRGGGLQASRNYGNAYSDQTRRNWDDRRGGSRGGQGISGMEIRGIGNNQMQSRIGGHLGMAAGGNMMHGNEEMMMYGGGHMFNMGMGGMLPMTAFRMPYDHAMQMQMNNNCIQQTGVSTSGNLSMMLPRTMGLMAGGVGGNSVLPASIDNKPPIPEGPPPSIATAATGISAPPPPGYRYPHTLVDKTDQSADFGQMTMIGRRLGSGFPTVGSSYGSAVTEESSTVRCSGIPSYITESDLYSHFVTFGRVLELRISPGSNVNSNNLNGVAGGKVYGECLVQFVSAMDAKKCVTSPLPVLNNRFIRVSFSRGNIIPPGSLSMYTPPIPAPTSSTSAHNLSAAESSLTSSAYGRTRSESFNNDQFPSEMAAAASLLVAQNMAAATAAAAAVTAEQANRARVERAEAGQAVLKQFGDLRALRAKSDAMYKQREALLQGQIDQYKSMLSKLTAGSGGSEDKAVLAETVESRLMDLQAQMQATREQRERGDLATESGTSVQSSGPVMGGRGRGGRVARGGRMGRGAGRFASFGRGRGAIRGRGRGAGRAANLSIDNRPKSLLVVNPPGGFVNSAEGHFSRFGEVVRLSEEAEGVIVEFAARKQAEQAKVQAASYSGQMLTLTWAENHTSQNPAPETQEDGDEDYQQQQQLDEQL